MESIHEKTSCLLVFFVPISRPSYARFFITIQLKTRNNLRIILDNLRKMK